MKCVSCGADLYAGERPCPRCGAFVAISRTETGPSLLKPLLILAALATVFGAAILGAAVHFIRAQFVANPVYQQALTIARSSPEMQTLIGQPIKEGWMPVGLIRKVYGSDFAEWTVSLKGPKGLGGLHCVANRIGSSWHYSRIMFISNDGSKAIDVTPLPERDKLLLKESAKKVYLVTLGATQEGDLAWAPDYYKAKFGLTVEVLPVVSLDGPLGGSVRNASRHQLIAENVIGLMKQVLPEEVKNQNAIVIGVTREDMYISSFDWRYAINYRVDGRFAVVSTARLRPWGFFQKENKALEASRLQKMITKNVYVLCFDVPLSSDYTSAVSTGVMSPEEVDYMSDEIIGAEGRWDPQLSGSAPTISMVLAPEQPAAWNMEWCSKPPTDASMEYFAANLWSGVLIERKTDFYLDGGFPLQFVRVYGSGDKESREFGVGTNDSLDISIAGVPGTYMQLMQENGVWTRFDRDTGGDSGGRQAYRGRVDYLSPFSQGRILMRGYDSEVETSEGWHYFFPFCRTCKSEWKLAALTGYSDPQGHRYEMQRNKDGDLLSITTPDGKWLHFECDGRHRYHRIEDSQGRVVNYEYDGPGRLIRVADSEGSVEFYRYDDKNRMVAVLDGNAKVRMKITYTPEGWITSQTLGDGRTFQYAYRRTSRNKLVEIQFTDPRGYVTLFTYTGDEQMQSLPAHSTLGKPDTIEPFLE